MHLFATPSPAQWLHFGALLFGLLLFVGTAEGIRTLLGWSPEVTRKLVHILTGILIYFAPVLFDSGIPAILLAVIFISSNFAAVRLGLLKGMHGTNRESYGTVYYPLAFLILVLIWWDTAPAIISISILVLAIGDATAAIVGENLRTPHIYHLTSDKKSVEGSFAMFLSTAVTVAVSLPLTRGGIADPMTIAGVAIVTAAFSTAWEAIGSKGFDNLTVPLSAAFMLSVFLAPGHEVVATQILSGLLLGAVIAGVALRVKFLTLSGSVATFLLATIVYGVGGWRWTVPILLFFIASSILSKAGTGRKKRFNLVFEKNDTRDVGQVAANGGVAGIIAILWYFFPSVDVFYPIYLASLAAVTADTWGTEIGVLSRAAPRSIIGFSSVEAGTSGGVTLQGSLGGLAGALLILTAGALMDGFNMPAIVVVAVIAGGLGGSIVDSVLGATIQGEYRCRVCSKVTERKTHCDKETELIRGLRRIDNDVVNWGCAVAGAAIAAVVLILS